MKKLTTLILLLLSPLVVAQEKQAWACQGILNGTAGFGWIDRKWNNYQYEEQDALAIINGKNSTIKVSGSTDSLECSLAQDREDEYWSCKSDHQLFLLNPATGQAGLSEIVGAISSGGLRISPIIVLFECTKF